MHAAGARALRVRLSRAGSGVRLVAADESGAPVVSVDSLVLRELTGVAAPSAADRSVFELTWRAEDVTPAADVSGAVALGEVALPDVPAYPDVAALVAAVEAGRPAPGLVLLPVGPGAADDAGSAPDRAPGSTPGQPSGDDLPGLVRAATSDALGAVQAWLATDALADTKLAVTTRDAVAALPGDRVTDLAGAAVWGLLRSAQSEHPDRIVLADLDGPLDADAVALLAAVAADPAPTGGQLTVRAGTVLTPRVTRPAGDALTPQGDLWHVAAVAPGTIDGVDLLPDTAQPLAPGQVRIAVRAAGVNFRDVLIALGMYPDPSAVMGSEGAGVVLEVGPGVDDLAPGDRVFGLFEPGFGPEVVAQRLRVARIPAGWSFVEAASVPVVFLTAYYALHDLAGLRSGESVLVHSGAGGVGMAAIQLAHHFGATVYATASPGKWGALRELGVAAERIGSSRSTEFEQVFASASGGAGVDVVLDALAGEFVDASLRLLPRGGRFVEMGKTDVRDPELVARQHPGVTYQAFELNAAGGERIGQMLGELLALFESGALRPLPVRVWDVRQARQALRHLSQARHVGKVVLTVPAAVDPDGTTLVTGASGTLAGVVARHLVATGQSRRLVLASRRLPVEGSDYAALVAELTDAGAQVTAVSVDVADPGQVAGLVAGIDPAHPLTAVIHTAGVIADATIGSLSADGVAAVMRPKVDGAWALHEATAHLDLSAFVVFSSIAATLGSPGQGNYAAANAFLDALAQHRRAQGLPATSLAWGLWATTSAMTAHLDATEHRRAIRAGSSPLTDAEGLALLDAAQRHGGAHLVLMKVPAATGGPVPALLRDLVRQPHARRRAATRAAADLSLGERLAALSPAERRGQLLDLVAGAAAAVLGHRSADTVDPQRPFKELGFDSLTSVELRNRLAAATGLRLPATVAFDYPTPAVLADFLDREVGGRAAPAPAPAAAAATGVDEPIAIVGMACRFPGDVRTPEQLWDLVTAGADVIAPFPTDRGWDLADLSGDAGADTATPQRGGFLYDAADFDAAFFGISPREALAMDPQQRLLLETSWEAFERAGIDPLTARGSSTGVYVGLIYHDYAGKALGTSDELDGYVGNGSAGSVASGRISYLFGLEGPAVTVDTACSSSLVALHLAAQALRQNECQLALAGGVSVMSTPGMLAEFSRQRGLSPDGRCRAFGAGANGTGFAEGVGMLLLERLSDAQRNGHRVLAVVRGSAVNQDGASSGLTAPNGPAQQRVIRQALANARLTPADVDAVEAHGTGTALGDPIEAQALLTTYGQDRPADRPLLLGSIKSNIGHAQAAAGVAGVIKMVMAMRHGQLPATLHVDTPSEHIDWSAGAVSLLAEPRPWPEVDRPRRAAVSSFGISGTNVHTILEAAPEATPAPTVTVPATVTTGDLTTPCVLSARTGDALAEQARRLSDWLGENPAVGLPDLGHALATGRSAFEHRAVLLPRDRQSLLAGLAAVAAAEPSSVVVRGVVRPGRLAVLFSGQGAQRPGMGREAYGAFPAFAAALDEACRHLDPLLPRPLRDVLFATEGSPDAELLDQTVFTQAGLFAVEVALYRLVESFGVVPDLVGGHSVGEITAAHVAGVLSLADACALVAARGRLMQALPAGGGMLAVAAAEADVRASIEGLTDRLGIAAVNGPTAVVVSGAADALDAVEADWRNRGVRTRRLRVSHAFHSPLMEPMLAGFRAVLDGLTFQPPTLPVVSNLTGVAADPDELCDPGYWVRHVREAVRFADGIAYLRQRHVGTYLEVGPDGVLAGMISDCLAGDADTAGPVVVPTLRRGRTEASALLAALAEAYAAGVPVDWAALTGGGTAVRPLDLPTYPFQRQRYWPDAAAWRAGDVSGAGLAAPGHPLLGAAVRLAGDDEIVLSGRLSVSTHPWLADHVVAGAVVVPGAALVELVVRAGDEVGASRVRELTIAAPLTLPVSGGVRVQVRVGAADDSGGRDVAVHSQPDEDADAEWVRHADGVLEPAVAEEPTVGAWPPVGMSEVDLSGWYDALVGHGLAYGPVFQGLRRVWTGDGELCAEVALPESAADASAFGVHPALLDAALHPIGLLDAGTGPRVPFAFTGVQVHAAGARALRVRLSRAGSGVRLVAADGSGAPVVSVDSLVLRELTGVAAPSAVDRALFEVTWQPQDVAPAADGSGWVALGDAGLPDAVPAFADVSALVAAVEAGRPAPAFVLLPVGAAGAAVPDAVRDVVAGVLGVVQGWLAADLLEGSRLVVVTRGAVVARDEDRVSDLAGAAVWGLLRSAQSEHPDRIVLADTDEAVGPQALAVLATVAADPSTVGGQLALRGDAVCVPRLVRQPGAELTPPADRAWHVAAVRPGTLDGVEIVAAAPAALAPGEVRIAVRATGVNFRDVLIALGMYPDPSAVMGSEGAGVVVEVGPGVDDLIPGDRVFGLFEPGFGPEVVAQRLRVARVPSGWSFVEAASVPVVFLTAYYALHDLAGLRSGESVLVHSGAGGVGMAAIQLAHHFGATVYATASPGKWGTLRELGVAPGRIGSSRSTEFEQVFASASGGAGVDVVLDALAGEFVDASLRLLPRGGRFVEMGKTDVRDAAVVAAEHPGVAYRAFDLNEAGGERIGQMLAELLALFESGALRPLPVRVWDVRQARQALRHLSQARHVGKVVLTVPVPADAEGTTLVTGASGALAGVVARHLVESGRSRRLVLASRRLPVEGSDYAALVAELTGAGAQVTAVSVDVADPMQVAGLVAGIDPAHPLTAVVHTAGVIADATIGSLSADGVATVMGPKVDGAWALHEATADLDLSAFVVFSSIAATLGSPGQGNYAAANAFLDALAQHRRAIGLPATSIGWGMWATASGMTAQLGADDRQRLGRLGMTGLTADEGAALLDAATARAVPAIAAARLRITGDAGQVPPILRLLARAGGRRQAGGATGGTGTSWADRLAGLASDEARRLLVDLVCGQAAAVLGHASAQAVAGGRAFKELGFDSLTSVELRNRLASATGLRLTATLVFDYPTPERLAEHLHERLGETPAAAPAAARAAGPAGTDEPIAIIGMSCRFPGGVSSPEQLWDLVASGGDAIGGFPGDRGWDLDALYDPDADRAGTSTTRQGGFLYEAAEFDPGFFGISPREALAMDPQQRLLLETSWEAFEHAGIDPATGHGTSTGVFIGAASSGYAATGSDGLEGLEGHLLTGTAGSVASGRVAYTFGFEGPAVTVDTACSSSLVALHLAAQALRSGECDMALAGGVALMAQPGMFSEFSRQGGLAPDGRCKAFAAAADGTGWGEGVGILLVERLSDARRRGHRVLAVVRGSAVNSDGASNGLTAPNGPSQQRVIRQALANARLTPADVDAVEAHGTGTTLGDPIEAQALLATYGQDRPADRPLLLGSIKSNIGHTQAAAGVAGVIKMVMAMRHGLVPPTLHVDEPSEHIDWTSGAVTLTTDAAPWPAVDRPRRAAVSSFGISGTNAHAIIEQAPAAAPAPRPERPATPSPGLVAAAAVPLLVSARSARALRDQAARLRTRLADDPALDLVDLAYSLATGRAHHPYRQVTVAADRDSALAGLAAVAEADHHAGIPDGTPKVVFVFPGQGSQWAGMALDLLESSPVFRNRMDQCAAELSRLVDWNPEDVLRGAPAAPPMDRVDVVQPLLFSVMVSLAEVWKACGVRPDAVIGHSQGEIAAACAAGALTLPDAMRLVVARSRGLLAISGLGGMVSVPLSAADTAQLIAPWAGALSVAAVNGAAVTVVSGDAGPVDELLATCAERDIRARRIAVDYASHCGHVEAVREDLAAALGTIEAHPTEVAFHSTVTGEPIDTVELDADYWYRNLREPVRLAPVVDALIAAGYRTFVEVSPHPVLKVVVQDALDRAAAGQPGVVVGSLRRDEHGPRQLLAALGDLHTAGVPVDWAAVLADTGASRVDLPTYAFQRERFWPEVGTWQVGDVSAAGLGVAGHPLLGAAVRL
ncbi:SDR family NAD(P)-dependent oxidoreductase, partial [Micromonospora carbonacea]